MNARTAFKPWLPYLLAIALAGLAGVCQVVLNPYLQTRAGFALFFLAIVVSARLWGPVASLVCLGVSLILYCRYVLPPEDSWLVFSHADVISLVVVTLVGLAISRLAGSLHSAMRHAEEGRQKLVDLNVQLLEANKRFRQLGDAIPQVVWAANPDGSIDLFNARWYEYTGQKPGDDPYQAIHPDDLPRSSAAWSHASRTGEPYRLELRLRRHDGVYRWHLSRMLPVRDLDGNIEKWFGTSADIEDQRQTLDAVRESEARFRMLADESPVMVWASGPDNKCYWFNKVWLEFTGRTPEQEQGHGWTEGVHPDDLSDLLTKDAAVFQARGVLEIEYRLRRHDGQYRWVLDRGVPRFEPDGTFAGYLGSCIDIHDRKLAEQLRDELLQSERTARVSAEETARLKDEFLATVSHELRTPLNAILGWLQLLGNGRGLSADEIAEGLETITRNAKAQAQLVNDLLDMSRIVTGKTRLELKTLDLRHVVTDAVQTVRPVAQMKNISLHVDLGSSPMNVTGDEQRLAQVVWNLVSNSIKFTPEAGHVDLSVNRSADGGATLVVSDNGTGISPDFLPFVFDRFRQADGSTTRKTGGLGLGLAIVRHLVELHGGTVRAESDGAGKGTRMTVTLPGARPIDAFPAPRTLPMDIQFIEPRKTEPATTVEASESAREQLAARPASSTATYASDPAFLTPVPEEKAKPVARSLQGLRVLVVDDEPDAREMLKRSLRDRGAQVTTAGGVSEALEVSQSLRPELVVSDIGMPDEDGFALLSRLRSSPDPTLRELPVIALTAFAAPADQSRALAAGFDAYLVKPVDFELLAGTVASLTEKAR